jgi:peptidoglycan/xylan/chitin deacetylase (PgdA/CDA1 family)
MPNMRRRLLAMSPVLACAFVALSASPATALPEGCPRKGTLGTSRILKVDPAAYPRVGLKNFPQTLPLRDHEVVLTFDDGPWPPTTPKVLEALARECVLATFFLIGKPASEHPDLVKRIAAEGHVVASHTWLHRSLRQIPPNEAVEEIDHGIEAVKTALQGGETTSSIAPFFRFPGFETTPATLDLLQSRGIAVFGADFWASDWEIMTPQHELKLLIDRLKVARRGIILLHDPKAHTAAMLPAFLRYLRENHYHIVLAAPADPPVDKERAP